MIAQIISAEKIFFYLYEILKLTEIFIIIAR